MRQSLGDILYGGHCCKQTTGDGTNPPPWLGLSSVGVVALHRWDYHDLEDTSCVCAQAATRLLEDMCHLTAQSLNRLETSEHFQIVKLLGQGSYGKVMLAVHNKSGTPMALKFFPRKSTSLPSFLREYNLSLSFCTHPSLSRAVGIAYFTSSHYVFAQQASLFGDLYDLIVPEVGLEEDCCQRVVSQLGGALSHLHSLGFVHRDVKPENVFLCDATCRWVKLGDFGMVKARGSKVPEVWYRSPYCTPEAEVARGDEDSRSDRKSRVQVKMEEKNRHARVWTSVEPSTDSWALGILTYAMLTGTHPWAQTSNDCCAYLKYLQWLNTAKSPEDNLDVWAEPPCQGTAADSSEADLDGKERPPVAPQFACFTPLAHAFFHLLLNPSPQARGRPEDSLAYLGGAWLLEGERARLDEERRKSRGKGAMKNVKETEGRALGDLRQGLECERHDGGSEGRWPAS
ncbi:serine/threonine-protein kinase SBK1 isoform X2 [Dunckerocampus dactyliophorus]|uniref:serine/threonine-protein kinase SBK1 isoform X2 n=1 Tax=Dunckerocampus dactyliophorus TaxID=161453 RepID=UPI002406AC7B|nr:serine/threonine-protein kinase SBK1 isoform X2 [Dunckerocampus dactyliophorus]